MNCQFRTIRAGSAALGLSVVVASVTWQSVLLLFMATGVGFSLWTWLKDKSKQGNTSQGNRVPVLVESGLETSMRDKLNARVYQFRYPIAALSSRRK